MGISLSNKDYIVFTIKKKKKRERKRHDYDATADYNKTIIKEPRKREKKGEKRKRNIARVLLNAPSANRLHTKGERRCGRTGCVRGAYAN